MLARMAHQGCEVEYSIFNHSGREPLNTVELHVLARAYRAAWHSLFASDPVGPHVIGALDVLFVFQAEGRKGGGGR